MKLNKEYYLNTPEGKIKVLATHFVNNKVNIIWNENNFLSCSKIIGRQALININLLEEIK